MKKIFDCLEGRFKSIQDNISDVENNFYKTVMSSFSSKVISKGPFFNIKPFEIQRAGFKIGKEIKSLPKSIKNTHIYFFDADNKLLLVEMYGKSESIINREFVFYTDDGMETIYFNSGCTLRNITFSKIEDGFLMKDFNYGKYGSSISIYNYNKSELIKIEVKQKEHAQNEFSLYDVEFKYENGELSKIINCFPNGYKEQRYP